MEDNMMTAFERMKDLLSSDSELLKQTTEYIKTLNNPFPETAGQQNGNASQQDQAATEQTPTHDYSDCKTKQQVQEKLKSKGLTPGTKEYNDIYQKYDHLPLLPDPDYKRFL